MWTTIIIDDESIARHRLIQLLNECEGRFEVIGEAKNGIEGAKITNELKPDLIFLDIQMPGKTGFDMLETLDHIPKVVFCTAYEEFALKAFQTLALDYLVKPVEKERLQFTLEKLERSEAGGATLQIQQLLDIVRQKSNPKTLQSIPYKTGDRIILVKVEKIAYFTASEKYVEFSTAEGKTFLTELSLKRLAERLPNNFRQIHRGTIVNIEYVKEFRKYFKGKYILELKDAYNTKLETSSTYSADIRKYLSLE